ncbi:MAG: chromosome segregation protein SMC [Acidobacteria bacterium]|nr:chromosome segregation protein SMC [Acidobacteriota bacterium]
MRLDRLQISGFKSFSDRSELAFDGGVTAIVGPNGCGKSNVADALTWVLGEQSAKSLRGDKMEDVIFSGSDARKPTGAAEVRLRLSGVPMPPTEAANGHAVSSNGHHASSNGHEPASAILMMDPLHAVRDVEVTRRLYRSGESEYLIDGAQCRLRDVHELLMDTGLGAKAYSIIEQGKIGMILSSRPTDRRQLIEEAAGVTKYKARRRAAELKLDAAQQNLTRLDDIVFEVEKQCGSLKRQAGKARRYQRLRDEMRRWEKVLFARRYHHLAEHIESARTRLNDARQDEVSSSARLAEVEAELARVRIELAKAEQDAAGVREAAHGGELDVNRRQQQLALDAQQATMLQTRIGELEAERQSLEGRREPERLRLEERRAAIAEAERAKDEATEAATAAAEAYDAAQRAIASVEAAVEQARGEVYAVMNTVTALTTAIHHATSERERAAAVVGRLDVEARDLDGELNRAVEARDRAAATLRQAQSELAATEIARGERERDLAAARIEHEWREQEKRQREHDLAGASARLLSLEEIEAARAAFSDGARMLLATADASIGQRGALADYLEVQPKYERAVEATLGDLLEHVVVDSHSQAHTGFRIVRAEGAGRCGFIVISDRAAAPVAAAIPVPEGCVTLSSVVRVVGPLGAALATVVGEALITDSLDRAASVAAHAAVPVVTLDGDVYRGPHVVSGGSRTESTGILATKREIRDLRDKVEQDQRAIAALSGDLAGFSHAIALASAAVTGLVADGHRHEKAIVAAQADVARAGADEARVRQRVELVAAEGRSARESIEAIDVRQSEAQTAITRLNGDRGAFEAALADRQQQLADARDNLHALGQRAAEARASHAALSERSVAVVAEVQRLQDAAREVDERAAACRRDMDIMGEQRERLLAAGVEGQRLLDESIRALEDLRDEMLKADDETLVLKSATERQEQSIRDARRALDAVRALAAELDISRATGEAELSHLAQQSLDAVQADLDTVAEEVAEMERQGIHAPDARVIRRAVAEAAESPDDDEVGADVAAAETGAEAVAGDAAVAEAAQAAMTAEEAIAELRAQIERLGPVNMMAIQQFSELDGRRTFLTTQRQDLVDSIAQTNEAIKKIDETTHVRFRDAFTAINANFQVTFATLFGGGKAGITLLDESDPLESGIDIVASPPGKRLQSVMLLSGGEKALTAIALMFAIFKYKPSPFCLLDEIDAPLDDANIGRFVELLRSMLDRTQFIIITHSRKTMEIANRLYGVTMEEPGVSKVISLQMN